MSYCDCWQRRRPIASGLKHRELNHTVVFDLATREPGASGPLELGTMLVKIAESLILRPKRRLEPTHLPNRADRQHEIDRLPLAGRSVRDDPDTLAHRVHLLLRKSDPANAGALCAAQNPCLSA